MMNKQKNSNQYLEFLLFHCCKPNKMPSYTNIAKHLKVSKQAVHELYYHRGLDKLYKTLAHKTREDRRKAKLCIKCGERPVKKLYLKCCEQCFPKHDPNPYLCVRCGKICIKNKRVKGFCRPCYQQIGKEGICIRCKRKRSITSHKCCASCYGTLLIMFKRYRHLPNFGIIHWRKNSYDKTVQLEILAKMKPRKLLQERSQKNEKI